MSITYFYRSLQCGFSIKKVFHTLTDEIGKTHDIHQVYIPSHRADPISVLKNIWCVFKNRNKKGINHVTGDVHYCLLGLIGCRSVLTIHDMSALDEATHPIKKMFVRLIWFKLPLLIADKVVCISEHTRDQLMKLTKRKDIEVIYNAVDPSFQLNVKPFNNEMPVILHIGTAWNKNLLNTIKAIASIQCHLVIIGEVDLPTRTMLDELKISHSCKVDLTDQEVMEAYINCDVISFCSLYEGFGMPIIEGFATGRVVITSSISPMREIAGNGACLVDPTSVVSIKNGFTKVITDDGYREILIRNGQDRMNQFKVAAISKRYVGIYEQLM